MEAGGRVAVAQDCPVIGYRGASVAGDGVCDEVDVRLSRTCYYLAVQAGRTPTPTGKRGGGWMLGEGGGRGLEPDTQNNTKLITSHSNAYRQ